MWIYIIYGVTNLMGGYAFVYQSFMLTSLGYGFLLMFKIKNANILDACIFIYFLYFIFNALLIDYPRHETFLVYALVYQFSPFMFYFIARSNELELEVVLKKMMIPITIAMVFGLYCYITEPEWYMAIKWAWINDVYGQYVTDRNVIEKMRLTSFWDSSYYMAFSTLFYSAYLMFSLVFKDLQRRRRILYYILLGICVLVLTFGQHRVCLFAFVLIYVFCIIKVRDIKRRTVLLIGAGIIGTVFIILVSTSPEYYEYVMSRLQSATSEEGINERFEHTGGGQDLLSLFGDGYGSHSLRARDFNGWAIIDNQYQNVLGELGIVGFVLFVLILLISTALGLIGRRKTRMELFILFFYLVAFFGSSPLIVVSEYSFLFWYTLGKISQKSVIVKNTYAPSIRYYSPS